MRLTLFTEFKTVMEKRRVPVDQVVDSVRDARIDAIVKTIIFCGKQNIPLRGHIEMMQSIYRNLTLIRVISKHVSTFVSTAEIKYSKNIFKINAPKTATYRSKTIQNEIVECCGELLQKKSSKKLRRPNILQCSPMKHKK